MTAEIAVMNKSAVALAADSAVTLQMQRGHKIYTTNKLFTLSKYHPVGIMIYGEAELLGVPWETVVKTYRKQLGKSKFRTLREHSEDFIKFLENCNNLFPDSVQKNFFLKSLGSYYTIIKEEINKEVKQRTNKKKITKSEIERIVNNVINKRLKNLEKLDRLPNFSTRDERNLINKYSNLINQVKGEIFVKLPIKQATLTKLRNIGAFLFSRKIFQKNL